METRPSYHTMEITKHESDAAFELLLMSHEDPCEKTSLATGDRVFLLTIEGEFTGDVIEDWTDLDTGVWVRLDCAPDRLISFHRSLFRAFTVLDHISSL